MFEYIKDAGLVPVRPYTRRKTTKYIIIHHSAGLLTPAQIHAGHIERGYKGIGYGIVIDEAGQAWWGRGIEYIGGGTKDKLGYNAQSVDICFIGNLSKHAVPDLQLAMGRRVVRDLLTKYPDAKILGHKDVDATQCPGNLFPLDDFKKLAATPTPAKKPAPVMIKLYRVRKSWKDAGSQIGAFITLANAKALANKNPGYEVYDPEGKAIYPVAQAKPPSAPKPAFTLKRLLKYNPNRLMRGDDVEAVQRALKAAGVNPGIIDGILGKRTWRAIIEFQRAHKLIPDGIVGPKTAQALGGIWAG